MRTPAEVVELYNQRVRDAGVEVQAAREVTDLYGGDIWVPLPEVHKNERPAIANIARGAIDQKGMRIASVFPEITVWPNAANVRSQKRAKERRRGFYGMHQISRTNILMRRRARHLVGYASAPVKIVPDFNKISPVWKVRSPVATYASTGGEIDEMNPADCIFVYRQTLGWVRRNYANAHRELFQRDDSADTPVDVLEYYDDKVIYLIAAKRGSSSGMEPWSPDSAAPHTASVHATLLALPNRIHRCPVVIPGSITLGPRRSVYGQLIGMYQAASELESLSRIALRGGIKQEAWLQAHPGDEARIVQVPRQWEGIPGIVEGGDLQFRSPDPQFASRVGVNDLERSERVTAGIPAEFGGESGGENVRTARRAGQVLRAVLDFDIQEAHDLFQASMELENEIAALTDLHYFGDVPKVWSVRYAGEKGDLAYTPSDLWRKNDPERTPAIANQVSYSMAGFDAEEGIIGLGQRLGMGTISKRTIMAKDPVIDDVDSEEAQVIVEALQQATLTQLQTLAASPEIPFETDDLIKLTDLVQKGKTLTEAWAQVQKEAVEREQAAADPNDPATAGTIEAAPEDLASIQGPNESQSALGQLLLQLRAPTFATAQEGA